MTTALPEEVKIQELIKCMDPETGFMYFARNFVYIQHPNHGKLLFEPFDYQVDLMESNHTHNFNINLLPRQTGKTTCAIIYMAWTAMFGPDQTVEVACRVNRDSIVILSAIRYLWEMCPEHIRSDIKVMNKREICFSNGSSITAAQASLLVPHAIKPSLLYCDEMAYIEESVVDNFQDHLPAVVATPGRIIISSTWNPNASAFTSMWKDAIAGKNGFVGFTIPWDAHPQRNEEWKKEQIQRIGVESFEREYLYV